MDIVDEAYKIVKQFPSDEQYGLTSQIKRCSISIPSNIAEGWGRKSRKANRNFLTIARASLFELETQVEIARRQKFVLEKDTTKLMSLIVEESKMLTTYIKKMEN